MYDMLPASSKALGAATLSSNISGCIYYTTDISMPSLNGLTGSNVTDPCPIAPA